ncbi:hypothetical protein TWF281_010409 [Arthrobotrys megalospora]
MGIDSGLFVALLVAYTGGFLKFQSPAGDMNPETLGAFQLVSGHLGSFCKGEISQKSSTKNKLLTLLFAVTFVIIIACYMPIYRNLPVPFQPWVHCLIFAAVAVVGLFAPTARFYGPLRFGYVRYSPYLHQLYKLLVNWWLYASIVMISSPIALPIIDLCLIAATIAWIKVYHEYHARLRDIIKKATEIISEVALVEQSGRELAVEARRYQDKVHEVAISAREYAIRAQSVKFTEFLDRIVDARAALGLVTDLTDRMVENAEETLEAIGEIQVPQDTKEAQEGIQNVESEGEEETEREQAVIQELQDAAAVALAMAKEKLNKAKEIIERSQGAYKQRKTARVQAESNAKKSAAAAVKLEEVISKVDTSVFRMAQATDSVRAIADQAIIVATDGNMEPAETLIHEAKVAALGAVAAKELVESALKDAKSQFFQFLQNP